MAGGRDSVAGGEPSTTVASLAAQHLRAYTATRDGETVFVIGDDEIEFEVSDEMGSPERAILALERLASAALGHAELIRRRQR